MQLRRDIQAQLTRVSRGTHVIFQERLREQTATVRRKRAALGECHRVRICPSPCV